MRTKKFRLEPYLFYDYHGIETHLEQMARRGWRLRRVAPFYWEYRRAEPEARTFAVTYFSEASEFNPASTENQRTFHGYCLDAGWELEAEWAQMQVFSTAGEDSIPIETDESSKLRAINRAMWKNFLPGNLLMLLLAVVQLLLQGQNVLRNPVRELSSPSTLLLAAAWVLLALCEVLAVGGYLVWRLRSGRSVAAGGTCLERRAGHRRLNLAVLAVTWAALAAAVGALFLNGMGWLAAASLAGAAALILLVLAFKSLLKRLGVPAGTNRAATVAVSVVLSLLLTGGVFWLVLDGIRGGRLGRSPAATELVTMPNGTQTSWEIYRDPLPLTAEELYAVDGALYSRQWTHSATPLVSLGEGRQDAPFGSGAPELFYTVADIALPALFEPILEDYLRVSGYENELPPEERRQYRRTDDPAWGADRVYELFYRGASQGKYLVCWGGRIVTLQADSPLTAEQIAVAAERLGG